MSTSSDIEGAIFVGGDITNASTFGNNCNAGCTNGVDAVTVIGDINSNFNLVGNNSDGTRNVVYGGTISGNVNNNANGEIRQADADELSMLEEALESLYQGAVEDSENFSALASNGSVDDSDPNRVTFTPDSVIDGEAIVFDVSGELLSRNISLDFDALIGLNVPIIINVTGASDALDDTLTVSAGFIGNREGIRNSLIFNFNNYNDITFSRDGFEGSVLAPQADVTITNGAFDGGLVALSLDSMAELHAEFFDEEFEDPDVPVPPSEVPTPASLLLTVLALIYISRRRKTISSI
ncbi:choice-of-anchor A family protein [Alteromonas sp. 5E99-2]|nr:choice-of-anchor A family protein [Alteromonas sp. 5E99-2]